MTEIICPSCGWTVLEGGKHVCVESPNPEKIEPAPAESDPSIPEPVATGRDAMTKAFEVAGKLLEERRRK